jgi:uncharacterized protein (TIGR02996 family)
MLTNPEEDALIRAVIASPDDDLPRLRYADWLEAHGQFERARLIRVQCQLETLKAEESVLLERHQREWGGNLYANGVDHWVFHRGFPEEIYIALPTFLETHSALNAVTPLRQLHLNGGRDDWLEQLAGIPVLAQVRELEIDHPSKAAHMAGGYGLMGVRALATSGHLTGLQRLALHSHQIGVDGARIIAASSTFGNLTHLTLSAPVLSQCSSDVMLSIVTAPSLKNLVELRMGEETQGRQILEFFRGDNQSPHSSPPR